MKKFLKEFRTFAIKGNMLDLAVGVIVGAAFTAIITSVVTHIALPLIGILIGVDFSAWVIELPRLYGNAAPSTLGIGLFINSILNFIVVAVTVFLFVKALNKFRKRQETTPPPPAEPTREELLLAEIRDILKAGGGERTVKTEEPEAEAGEQEADAGEMNVIAGEQSETE